MRLNSAKRETGFTLAEMLVSTAVATLLFAGLYTAAIGLTRAYAAADDYYSTHLQQIRIIDYLARDVKRSFSVTTSPDLKTVTCIMPDYIVQTGDPEAVTDATTIGQRRTPLVVGRPYRASVDYGSRNTRSALDGKIVAGNLTTLKSAAANFTAVDVGNPIQSTGTNIPAGATITGYIDSQTVTLSAAGIAGSSIIFTVYGDGNRTVTDAATASGSTSLISGTAYFTAADVGRPIVGTSINAGTTIASVSNPTTAILSAAASATVANSSVTIGGTVVVYTVTGNTITRTENGVLTTIASATDQLLPQTTDWQLSNTEYTTSTVTFQPIFTMNGSTAQRSGTTVYSTAYLRNKRRGN
ncbi:MAG: prepilin-type N-terminal cleavage/methylation domain-containing protein [Verrucomicrobiota bacterium]|nr:prepilin-type N-terminal cleavage/methylation domain-containing protein [Verrucomicrobiota bacterium]